MALIDRALAMGKIAFKANADRMVKLCDVRDALNDTRTVGAMEVVRCRECSNYIEYDDWDRDRAESFKCHECNILHRDFGADGFCSYGKRKGHD